jgi:hypothetical protein
MKFRIILLLIICSINHCIKAEIDTQHIPFNVSAGNQGFIANKGQITNEEGTVIKDVLYTTSTKNGIVHILKDRIRFVLKQKPFNTGILQIKSGIKEKQHVEIIDMVFLNMKEECTINPSKKLDGVYNFYNGNKEGGFLNIEKWKTLTYNNLYKDIDFVLYINEQGEIQYDYAIRPGGNPNDIKVSITGAKNLSIDDNGVLHIITSIGEVEHYKPYSYQVSEVKSNFALQDSTLSFSIGYYNKQEVLTIDPIIRIWGSYYGDYGVDNIESIKTDIDNNIIYSMTSTSFGGSFEAILCKFTKEGKFLWQTGIGGTMPEYGSDIALDQTGNIIMVGMSQSLVFDGWTLATKGAHKTSCGFDGDGYIAKFSPTGKIIWFTYFGGGLIDEATNVVCDNSSNIYVLGKTKSPDGIATPNAFQTYNATDINLGNNNDCFLTAFNSSGKQLWGTYFGGENDEESRGIALDKNNNILICGFTNSQNNIASKGSHQANINGFKDGFVAKFSNGGQRIWSTYFGGSDDDAADDIASTINDEIVVVGQTYSVNNIATPGSFQSYKTYGNTNIDGFLTKITKDGKVVWSTYFGGEGDDGAWRIEQGMMQNSLVIDKNGNDIYVSGGETSSELSIATSGALKYQLTAKDAFVLLFDSKGIRKAGTYYGGSDYDCGSDIIVDSTNNIIICGSTMSKDGIATVGAYDPSFYETTYSDGFIGKLRFESTSHVENIVELDCNVSIIVNPSTVGSNIEATIHGCMGSVKSYTISDILGKVVLQQQDVNIVGNRLSIDTRSLPKGTYSLNVILTNENIGTTFILN